MRGKLQNGQGLGRILRAAQCSKAGLQAAWRNEAAFRQEAITTMILMPFALWLGENGVERALLGGSLLLMLVVELLNSAIEAAVDRIGLERHELAGRAKDLGSAAVGCTVFVVVMVWLLVLWP
ncbi:MAG: diacylglycerol kinase [bacterium]|nr:diacylglycerol kinase [bacterium]